PWTETATPPRALLKGAPLRRGERDAALKQRPPIVTPLTASQQRVLYQEIVSALVDELLVRQFLRQTSPPVDPAEVAKQVTSLERGLSSQGRTLAEYLKETHQTEAQLRANLPMMI